MKFRKDVSTVSRLILAGGAVLTVAGCAATKPVETAPVENTVRPGFQNGLQAKNDRDARIVAKNRAERPDQSYVLTSRSSVSFSCDHKAMPFAGVLTFTNDSKRVQSHPICWGYTRDREVSLQPSGSAKPVKFTQQFFDFDSDAMQPAVFARVPLQLSSPPDKRKLHISMQPKYGSRAESSAQLESHRTFIASKESPYKGDPISSAEIALERGMRAMRVGKLDEAMRHFNHGWLLDPKNPKLIWGMGEVSYERAHYQTAAALFDEALALNPGDPGLTGRYAAAIGQLALQSRDPQRISLARKLYDRTDALLPDDVQHLQNGAKFHYALGEYDAASNRINHALDLKNSVELDPVFVAHVKTALKNSVSLRANTVPGRLRMLPGANTGFAHNAQGDR